MLDDEKVALYALSTATDPVSRVLYHLSMRLFSFSERLGDTQNVMIATEARLRRIEEKQDKIAEFLDRKTVCPQRSGDSHPKLRVIPGDE